MVDEQRELEERIARELGGFSERRQSFDLRFLRAVVRASESVFRHWLLIANLVYGLITIGAVAVPLMMAAGWTELGRALFTGYHLLCEQNPDHSYFLLGYQFAMDQRMMAIYGSSLLGGLAYIGLRGRLSPLPWLGYFILILPMAVDGFTQLFGWRHSNWELRTATGTLFGLATIWLAYPHLDVVTRTMLGRGRVASGE